MAYFKCTKVSGGLKLIVTCDVNFAGSTITCTDGTHTYQKTCPSSSPYEVEYEGLVAGTYTISGVAQGVTHSTTVVMSDVTESLYSTPDGSTVVPTDDIQTLLHCANIWDKAYTTLSDLLADSTSLLAVTSDSNAVDYLVRSKTFIGRRALVPVMTSNTTPSGVVSASTETFPAYYAFNNDDSNFWTSALSDGQYIEYDFGEGNTHVVDKVSIKPRYTSSAFVKNFIVKGSNNGTTWDSLYSGTHGNNGNLEDFTFTNNNPYRYYRVYNDGASYADASIQIARLQFYSIEGMCDNSTAMTDIGANNYCANTLLVDSDWCDAICNSTYFESVLNVKVPTMTDNTHPSGEAILYNTPSQFLASAYKAFDNNLSTIAEGGQSTGSPAFGIGYHFTSPVMVKKVYFHGRENMATQTAYIQGSNDESTWADLAEFSLVANTDQNIVTNNTSDYSYYRVAGTSYNYGGAKEIQFYGREDV